MKMCVLLNVFKLEYDAYFHLSAVSISNRGRAVDKFPSPLLHFADARQRVRRAG